MEPEEDPHHHSLETRQFQAQGPEAGRRDPQTPRVSSEFDDEEKRVVRGLLEGMILKRAARRWPSVSNNGGERK